MVKLLRYRVRDDIVGEMTLDAATSGRPARNVSLGGMLVNIPFDELPQVRVGSIAHLSVSAAIGGQQVFPVRAAVTRRDRHGTALTWIRDSDRVWRAIESLLTAVAGSRRSA